ncbi:efflux RND transporter periplasmic adaptor subunit [Pseudoalteromonas sp. Of7M-16]|uniref:efflux RND transporter periplasmic adaptor subunit n=1 Tax=Pseudoalteromonas sp. Of7M-16 TaxID=2917756 RepID=UPI001EF560AE|nr:efflux RND transporter periplasmic adaptor subunit [Pseudoalteromonas sp. Of7M-16]MCG7547855.1 efflux RND transporter periplasmic adaptor subunit [Pseudoalteromonas sp. Of7M-16]
MKYKNIMAIGAGFCAIFMALIVVDELAIEAPVVKTNHSIKQPVSTTIVLPQSHIPTLDLIGNTRARFVTQLKVTSDGQLAWLDTELEPGALVKKATPLAKLDTTHLESEMAQAQSRVYHSELALEQQLHEQSVALSMLSSKNQSSFAKREPQVAAAKADLSQAKLMLKSMQKRFEEAQIVAPYDAVILSRSVSPGDWLSAGEALFEVAASDSIDVVLPISEPVWRRLKRQLQHQLLEINVTDRSGGKWPAQIRYIAPRMDLTTRQRQLILKVSDPYELTTRLMPNQPVQVNIGLAREPLSFKVPQSALTRDGFVWTVDDDGTLQKEPVEILSKSQTHTYIRFNQMDDSAKQVVVYPLLSMVVGTQVEPLSNQVQLADSGGA